MNIMINASESFKKALLKPISEVFVKLELLDNAENVIDIFTEEVSSDSIGDISVDSSRDIRRMFTLTLDNKDGRFTWNENGLIWIDNKKIKLYVGLKTPLGIEYIPQGVFVITQPQATHKPSANSVTINGQDKWYLLTGNFGRFTHETTIKKGTNIKEAIKIVAENAGIKKMILDNTDITVPYDLTFQIGQNRGKAIKDLASKAFADGEYFYDVYFDVNGYLRFTKHKDPLLQAPCWTYKIDESTLYAGSIRKLDDTHLFNHILVLGGSSRTAEFKTELVIDETVTKWKDHPYSIQKIGDRFCAWNNANPDSMIDTQSQCDARAKFELKKKLQFCEKVTLNIAPNYLHQVNDVVEIIDDNNGCQGSYQLTRFSIPLKPKIVSATANKIRKGLVI
ncbi:hypothetical protein PV797_04870 [Clostridiaceae bacterium M8S5]|nr:hypothetical protein PV797_04870 [Clostridiaceae bacterium M8S5]